MKKPEPTTVYTQEIFNEHTLRTEIAKTWGEYGAHVDVYDTLLKRLSELEALQGRWISDEEIKDEALTRYLDPKKLYAFQEGAKFVRSQLVPAAPTGWISVDESLPESGQHIVAYFNPMTRFKSLYVIPLWYSRGAWYYHPSENVPAEGETLKVTHWQPLPAAPTVTNPENDKEK
jgi:hypothetical protein